VPSADEPLNEEDAALPPPIWSNKWYTKKMAALAFIMGPVTYRELQGKHNKEGLPGWTAELVLNMEQQPAECHCCPVHNELFGSLKIKVPCNMPHKKGMDLLCEQCHASAMKMFFEDGEDRLNKVTFPFNVNELNEQQQRLQVVISQCFDGELFDPYCEAGSRCEEQLINLGTRLCAVYRYLTDPDDSSLPPYYKYAVYSYGNSKSDGMRGVLSDIFFNRKWPQDYRWSRQLYYKATEAELELESRVMLEGGRDRETW